MRAYLPARKWLYDLEGVVLEGVFSVGLTDEDGSVVDAGSEGGSFGEVVSGAGTGVISAPVIAGWKTSTACCATGGVADALPTSVTPVTGGLSSFLTSCLLLNSSKSFIIQDGGLVSVADFPIWGDRLDVARVVR